MMKKIKTTIRGRKLPLPRGFITKNNRPKTQTIVHIYEKLHVPSGKRYLGVCTQDPYKYGGGGKAWGKHLHKQQKKCGNKNLHDDVATKIWGSYILETQQAEFEKRCLAISKQKDIVNSEDYLNTETETGKRRDHTDETKARMKAAKKRNDAKRGAAKSRARKANNPMTALIKRVEIAERAKKTTP